MDDDSFSHHVTSANNDFSNWAGDVVRDDKLASDLKKAANAADAAKMVTETAFSGCKGRVTKDSELVAGIRPVSCS